MDMHYTIRPGDSLSDIAQRFMVDREGLYILNCGTLNQAALAHGKESSNDGTLLYPGTTIRIVDNGTILNVGSHHGEV